MKPFVSIIITHFNGRGVNRTELIRKSLDSLLTSTKVPFELTVIDNGQDISDSEHLLYLTDSGLINTYIRNANNMHFGWARDQGIALSHGEYICIADNDLIYKKGWLEECVKVLEATKGQKYYVTPMPYQFNSKYNRGTLEIDGKDYELNMRAGSNCFVIRREDLDKIGQFPYHRIAGTKWTDKAVRDGYLAIVLPGRMVEDIGFRKGYNFKETLPIELTLSDGTKVNYNQDI